MSHNAPPIDSAGADWGAAARDGQRVDLGGLVAALKRSFWLVAGCVLIALGLALFYVFTTPPGYVASAQLLIGPAKQQLMWQDRNVVDLTVDNAQVESQVEILRSERIANAVIGTLGLANDPEFRSTTATTDYERHRIALSRFQGALATRRIGQSYVIEIAFRSTDPAKAARITNAITAAYIRDQLDAKKQIARQAGEWMQERVEELGVQLNSAAAAVQKFRAANGISYSNSGNNQAQLLDQLTQLEARAEAYRKLYESFVQQMTENRQQESYPVSNARVIAAASTPLAKSYPKTKLVLLLSVLIGLLLGGGIAAARSMLDGSLRSTRQIRHALALDCLASLPRLRARHREGQGDAYQQILDAPFSPFTEGMRSIKLSLQNAAAPRPGLRIGFVSLLPGEGKTTVAIGLAALFAASGSKTLLIDADFRQASLSRRLLPGAKRGLIEAIAGEADDAVLFEPTSSAHILPVANGEAVRGSADMLGSAAMRQLLEHLGQTFATILVDLPALASAVDARAIGPQLDGCILVVECGRTPLEPLTEAVELLRAGGVRIVGAVLNKVENGIPAPFRLPMAGLPPRLRAAYGTQPAEANS
jgi:polysaccharide biosynthesis transport protein